MGFELFYGVRELAPYVQLVTSGVKLGSYRPDDANDELDIRVRLPQDERTFDALDSLRIVTQQGLIPVSNFIDRKAVPKVAIAPVLLLLLGAGETSKVVVAFLVAFFPIVVDTATGLAATPRELLDLSRSYRASAFKTFLKVRFPMALPFFFSGLKVAITLSVIGAVVGEFVGSDRGLGYVIVSATSYWKSNLAFGAMLLLAVMAVGLFALVEVVERLVCPWYVFARETGAKAHENDHRNRQPDNHDEKSRKTRSEQRHALRHKTGKAFPRAHRVFIPRFNFHSRLPVPSPASLRHQLKPRILPICREILSTLAAWSCFM